VAQPLAVLAQEKGGRWNMKLGKAVMGDVLGGWVTLRREARIRLGLGLGLALGPGPGLG